MNMFELGSDGNKSCIVSVNSVFSVPFFEAADLVEQKPFPPVE